ncbi:hypothetical protein CR513_52366, partial [Mucuna pruriens]
MTNQKPMEGENLTPQAQLGESFVLQEIMALRREMFEMQKRNTEEIETLSKENDELLSQYTWTNTGNMITRQQAEVKDAETQDAQSQREMNMRSKAERSYPKKPRLMKNPFVDGIIDTPCLQGGGICPWTNEHIDVYITQVNLFKNNDIILCRAFTTSLKGATLNW